MSVTLPAGAKELMLHALGLSEGGNKVSYRNYYTAPAESTEVSKTTWDYLVSQGLALKTPHREDSNIVTYKITLAGCRSLGSRLCERITVDVLPREEPKP